MKASLFEFPSFTLRGYANEVVSLLGSCQGATKQVGV